MSEISKVWVEDADFFKISRIAFGYDFKKALQQAARAEVPPLREPQQLLLLYRLLGYGS